MLPHLTVLPHLWVRLSAVLDLLHQSSEGLQGAGVDEGQALPLVERLLCAQTQTPTRRQGANPRSQIIDRLTYMSYIRYMSSDSRPQPYTLSMSIQSHLGLK